VFLSRWTPGTRGGSGGCGRVRPVEWLASTIVAAALAGAAQVTSDGVIVRGPTGSKAIALVFTGHEFAEGGDAILAALDRRRARGSFFLTGDFLRRKEFSGFVARVVRAGHYLGPHSDKHLLYADWTDKKTLVTRDAFVADLRTNLAEIERAGAGRPRLFLPAFEWCNAEIVRWAREEGVTTVNMTSGTRSNADYTEDGAANYVSSPVIVESILSAERSDPNGLSGFLLLMHVGAGPGRTDKLYPRLDGLLEALSRRGYRFVRVDELLRGSAR